MTSIATTTAAAPEIAAKTDARSDRRWMMALTAIFVAIGVAFILRVPPGLPYDEPSHFKMVQFHSQLQGLPIVTDADKLSYEAAQPPLYYFVMGLAYRLFSVTLSAKSAFYACRLLTLVIAAPLAALTYQTVSEFSDNRRAAASAGLLVAANPAILAVASSIQNDSLALVLSTLTALLTIRWCLRRTLCPRRMLVISILASAALMTKSSALSLMPWMTLMIVISFRRESVGKLAIFGVTLALCTGWWFVRNYYIYNDFSGERSVESVFGALAGGQKFHLTSPKDWVWAVRSIITAYSSPITYWRGEVKNPTWYTLAIAAGTAAALVGLAIQLVFQLVFRVPGKARQAASQSSVRLRSPQAVLSPQSFCAFFIFFAIALWLGISARHFGVSARVAMPAMAATLLFIAVAFCDLARRVKLPSVWVPLILGACLIAADAHLLHKAGGLINRPYQIRFIQASR